MYKLAALSQGKSNHLCRKDEVKETTSLNITVVRGTFNKQPPSLRALKVELLLHHPVSVHHCVLVAVGMGPISAFNVCT